MSDHSLISSREVDGTDVYGSDGSHVGRIDHLMIDKKSGHIAYAVMTFGGLLGIGESEHPIPWGKLSYDVSRGGYVTDISRTDLEGAPQRTDTWSDDPAYRERLYAHYAVPPYWI